MSQTSEQRDATDTLRGLAGRYRVTQDPDPEGWPVILGRSGQIEHYDGQDLAVWARPRHLIARLVEIGARRHQLGDAEARLLFAPTLLGRIAQVITAQRRRIGAGGTAEQMARIRARSPFGHRRGVDQSADQAISRLGDTWTAHAWDARLRRLHGPGRRDEDRMPDVLMADRLPQQLEICARDRAGRPCGGVLYRPSLTSSTAPSAAVTRCSYCWVAAPLSVK